MKRREFLQISGAAAAAGIIGLPDAGLASPVRPLPDGVMIIGAGGVGGRVVRRLIDDGLDPRAFMVIDADAIDLTASHAGLQILTGRRGPSRSWSITWDESWVVRNKICNAMAAHTKAVLVAGLGGRMANVWTKEIVAAERVLRKGGTNVTLDVVATMPFGWEAPLCEYWALSTLRNIQMDSDRVNIVDTSALVSHAHEAKGAALLAAEQLLTAQALHTAYGSGVSLSASSVRA